MAYVVARPAGRWEIRESFSTAEGPRSRTLASFSKLTSAVLDRAQTSARTPFDRRAVIQSARRAGASVERSESDALAGELLRRLAGEERVRPALRRLLVDRLAHDLPGPVDDSVADWIGASAEERGAALIELLDLADRLPPSRRGPLRFPGLARERLRR